MKKMKFMLFSLLLIAGVLSCSKDSSENQATVYGPEGTIMIDTDNNGGNVTCDEVAAGVGCSFDETSGKIDYTGGTGGTIDDIITWTTDGTYVSWESTVPVRIAIIVKGGNDANVYFSGCDEDDCVTSGTGLSAPVNRNGNPAGLSNITFCYSLCEEPICEDAFAKKTYAERAFCFTDYGFDILGWTNGSLDFGYSMYHIYAKISDCDINGVHVGDMHLDYYEDGTAQARFTMLEGFTLNEIQMYIGNEMFPEDINGDPTVAPEEYPYNWDNLGGVALKTVTVDGLTGRIYVIAHVVVCGEFPEEQPE